MSRVHRLDDVAASRWLRVTVPVSGNQAHQHNERSLVRRRDPAVADSPPLADSSRPVLASADNMHTRALWHAAAAR